MTSKNHWADHLLINFLKFSPLFEVVLYVGILVTKKRGTMVGYGAVL